LTSLVADHGDSDILVKTLLLLTTLEDVQQQSVVGRDNNIS